MQRHVLRDTIFVCQSLCVPQNVEPDTVLKRINIFRGWRTQQTQESDPKNTTQNQRYVTYAGSFNSPDVDKIDESIEQRVLTLS